MSDRGVNILGVIPARGGSKGIAGKNLRRVAGTTLVGHAIAAARESRMLTAFLVSTDSAEIATVAASGGAPVPFRRPPALATDEAPTTGVLQHALELYEREHRVAVHSVVTLQPTTPLRTARDIDAALEHYLAHQPEADSLISVCEASQMHPRTLYTPRGEWLEAMVEGQSTLTRRQDFDRVLWRNGAIYVTRRDLLMDGKRIVGQTPLFYEMPRECSVNIDEPFDLALAEWILSHRTRA
jgi:CMP-N,N'-diacetyllegionaminic acid synthase